MRYLVRLDGVTLGFVEIESQAGIDDRSLPTLQRPDTTWLIGNSGEQFQLCRTPSRRRRGRSAWLVPSRRKGAFPGYRVGRGSCTTRGDCSGFRGLVRFSLFAIANSRPALDCLSRSDVLLAPNVLKLSKKQAAGSWLRPGGRIL